MRHIRQLVAAAAAVCLSLPVWAAELVMVEQPGCEWCARWNEEIAPVYPKTSEGGFAPLRRVDLRALPDDLQVARRVMFTPTFLIVDGGRELARLEGYPGEDFFWPLLADLLTAHTGFVESTNTHGGS
ncbi:hypothetical protein [Leisingera sp.]|uniref:hypothetical protein n=1 Tax=Leisingera sp. TaxID=1879318 RepID=UPI002B273BA2|nr:hypothetical protein [Leisingera sp.]